MNMQDQLEFLCGRVELGRIPLRESGIGQKSSASVEDGQNCFGSRQECSEFLHGQVGISHNSIKDQVGLASIPRQDW